MQLRILRLGLLVIAAAAISHADDKADTRAPITSKSTGMKLAPIPAGTFLMGARDEDVKALNAKYPGIEVLTQTWQPQHKVELSAFYIGVYEVTQDEYKKVMGKNPSGPVQGAGKNVLQFPVTNVSWFDALEFCNKLSQKDGLSARYELKDIKLQNGIIASATVALIAGDRYRLPTEAEWEYACRGKTETSFNLGNSLKPTDGNFGGDNKRPNAKPLNRPAKVGSYKKNEFGLYDMHGNVGELCFDTYIPTAYQDRGELTKNPVVSSSENDRALRGGAFDDDDWRTASYSRASMMYDQPWGSVGFRVVRE